MKVLLFTLAGLASFMLLMALGYLFNRKVLKGSCAGLGKMVGLSCLFCDQKQQCKQQNRRSE